MNIQSSAKIHGAVVRGMPKHDSFVITENRYVDYLSHADIETHIPVIPGARVRSRRLGGHG